MKYTALTYSFSYLEPVCCSMSSSNCCFLICIQISQEAGQVVWYSHLLKNFPQFVVIHTVRGFGIVNKADIDVFLELSCFSHDPADVGNLVSGSSAFSKTSLNIRKFTVRFTYCWSLAWRILSISLLACAVTAKSLQSCPTLCDPRDGAHQAPPSLDSPGKNTGVGCHFLLQCMKVKVKSLSRVWLLATPWTAAYQAPPSLGFSRHEYWSGVPLPSCGVVWAFFGIAFLWDLNEQSFFGLLDVISLRRGITYDCCWRYSQTWRKSFLWSGDVYHGKPSTDEEGNAPQTQQLDWLWNGA